MACTYTGSIEGDRALFASETATKLTDMLCRTLRLIEEHNDFVDESQEGMSIELPKDIQDFWKEHKKIDEERLVREAQERQKLRENALAKLTYEEKLELGLDVGVK